MSKWIQPIADQVKEKEKLTWAQMRSKHPELLKQTQEVRPHFFIPSPTDLGLSDFINHVEFSIKKPQTRLTWIKMYIKRWFPNPKEGMPVALSKLHTKYSRAIDTARDWSVRIEHFVLVTFHNYSLANKSFFIVKRDFENKHQSLYKEYKFIDWRIIEFYYELQALNGDKMVKLDLVTEKVFENWGIIPSNDETN